MPRVNKTERRERQAALKELAKRSDTIYPTAKRMRISTRARSLAWRTRDRLAMRRKSPPKVIDRYIDFYKYVIERAREERAAKKTPGPVVIIIGGIAGGGKTTLARGLQIATERLYPKKTMKTQAISLDSYFKPRANVKVKSFGRARQISRIGVIETKQGPKGGRVIDGEFDNPIASDLKRAIQEIATLKAGGSITTKQRDVSTGQITTKTIDGSKLDFLIIEGQYTLHEPLAKLGDVKIGTQASLGQQFQVRGTRDIDERNRPPTDVARKFAERAPYQRSFVISTLGNAEIVMDVEKANEELGFKPRLGDRPPKIVAELITRGAGVRMDDFIDFIGLDHKRNTWRKLVKKEAGKKEPSIVLEPVDYKRSLDVLGTKKISVLTNSLFVDPYWQVREACAEALLRQHAKITEKERPKVYRALKHAIFKDPVWNVRATAISTFSAIFWRSGLKDLARVLDEGGNERLSAALHLEEMGFFVSGKPTPELEALLKDKSITIKKLEDEARSWGYAPESERDDR
jgi:uridine kinase